MPNELDLLRTSEVLLPISVPIRAATKEHHVARAPEKPTSELLASSTAVSQMHERTVLFLISDGGFSNVMMGLITSYVVAAFTNSTLLCPLIISVSSVVDPRYNFDSLFTVVDMDGNVVRKACMLLLLQ